MLLALDPSISACGVALFDHGVLVAASAVRLKTTGDILGRTLRISEAILSWCLENRARIDEIAVEWPQVYAATKSKGDPNGIVPLAAVCASAATYIQTCEVTRPLTCDLECYSYLPKEWAGAVPKSTTVKGAKESPRAIKVIGRLTPAEIPVWKLVKYHDTIDAIGIGLHHLGRFERRRVYGR